jgi:hypothetical protein
LQLPRNPRSRWAAQGLAAETAGEIAASLVGYRLARKGYTPAASERAVLPLDFTHKGNWVLMIKKL